MLRLLRGHRDMMPASRSQFLRRWTNGCSARATIKADPVDRGVVVDDGRVVGVAHNRDVNVGHGAVVVVRAASPVAAEEADAGVAEAVVNATIEADFGSPVAWVPCIKAVFPSPVPWSPEQTNFRREYPRAWNPEIAVRTVSPITRDPNVTGSGTNGLYVNWQHRRTNPNRSEEHTSELQ